jgi:trk system potassium uptake protein TrkH
MRDETLRYYCKIVALGALIFMVAGLINSGFPNWYSAIIDPLFQIVSTVTSTGFTVKGYETWGAIVPGVMILAMMFGACAGSTTGGAKLDRLLFLTKNCNNELYRTIHPNSIRSVRINGAVMPRETVNRVFVFLALFAIVVAVGAVLLALMGVPVGEAFFDTYSCITNNTGLNLNFAGIDGNGFTDLPNLAKWVLSLIMLIGRLELFSVLVLFTVAFWHK